MKRFNRLNRVAVLHFLTIHVREGKQAFQREAYARAALAELHAACLAHPAKLVAYVVMPTHMHCVINPRDGDAIHFTGRYKSAVTLAVHAIAEAAGQQSVLNWLAQTPNGHRQLWQDGKYDFFLYSERLIWQKIDYIHNNPIRAGLVQRADEYPYSSFNAWYPSEKPYILPIDKNFWWEDLPE